MNSTTELLKLAEPARIRAIARYDLFNPELRAQLATVCARTVARTTMPTSIVTIVLDSAQLFLAGHGLRGWSAECGGTPAEMALCAQVVLHRERYVVPDATVDPIQYDNPLVLTDGVRAYAGTPLRTCDGHILGAHCVTSPDAHQFRAEELTAVDEGAAEVMAVLDRYRRHH